ncbi:MAG: hypothetical protein R3297_01080 [Desulfobulbales bacterium]|nr:hypothetical protein [Desulfobulbales bacterium]
MTRTIREEMEANEEKILSPHACLSKKAGAGNGRKLNVIYGLPSRGTVTGLSTVKRSAA